VYGLNLQPDNKKYRHVLKTVKINESLYWKGEKTGDQRFISLLLNMSFGEKKSACT